MSLVIEAQCDTPGCDRTWHPAFVYSYPQWTADLRHLAVERWLVYPGGKGKPSVAVACPVCAEAMVLSLVEH
jgi:hypothetical protein